ncbi:FkbM family methyltransferase [Candidatus Pelagibacter communis]|uniref:FkbM family methyltransferase n=1 Tax=Pelagibacter ubique TaxID=198252 RepID=UPI00094C5C2B|nr:FkbM family methyltransferase [Candidatus Pelagibacter ubique]
MLSFILKIPILKRLIPSLYKKYIFFFKDHKKTIIVNGIYFDLDLRHLIDRRFFFHKAYENELFIPLSNIIEKYDVDYFFDIGSCWGIYSLRLAKKFNKLNIVAYDPIKKNIERLKNSIIKNKISNVRPLKVAIGDKKGFVTLGATETYSPNYEINEKNAVVTEKCEIDTLDNLHNNINDKFIALKIDTEGFEFNVLKGAEKLLSNNKVFCQIEIKNNNYQEVCSFLKNNNFKLISINKFNKTDYFFSNFYEERITI